MNELKIAIAGLGVVGAGVIKGLLENADLMTARTGTKIRVVAVSSRDKNKDRGVDISPYAWYSDAREMVQNETYDVLVETIGGSDGIALDITRTALGMGKHVVTANKAMLAHHGHELGQTAEQQGVCLGYEPAVAGGIPIINAMNNGLTGNKITLIRGILNGTCNYILTTMREQGRDFADVLADAQKLGYAEADPTFDIEGIDAAHKLTLLTALGFGVNVDFDSITTEGITQIQTIDQQAVDALGYSIKLLGVARHLGDKITGRVSPVLIEKSDMLSTVEGVFNAVHVVGDYVGDSVLVGRGAGQEPTASAVIADICDIARIGGVGGSCKPAFGVPARDLVDIPVRPTAEHVGEYYIRLRMESDKVSGVTVSLGQHDIATKTTWTQTEPDGTVWVIVLTEQAVESHVTQACEALKKIDGVVENPYIIRIEKHH